uniref:Uncharacterized protein n=1 Tax=virus sp. ctkyY8 TaxID=2827995 RepID=A0A8S5REJ1_9VIRU|nr:MAG TPA: hypothetical protein [virus sp. ctkyY8]
MPFGNLQKTFEALSFQQKLQKTLMKSILKQDFQTLKSAIRFW